MRLPSCRLAQHKNKFYLFVLFQLANIGHQLKEEIERVLTMISQFAFIHGDTNLLCLALLRRPPEPPLTLGKVIDTKYCIQRVPALSGFWELHYAKFALVGRKNPPLVGT